MPTKKKQVRNAYTEETPRQVIEEDILILCDTLSWDDLESLMDLPNDTSEVIRETMECYGDDELIDFRDQIAEFIAKKKADKKKRLLKVESKIFKAMSNIAAKSAKKEFIAKTAKHLANYLINQ